jgi:hypothetical protein
LNTGQRKTEALAQMKITDRIDAAPQPDGIRVRVRARRSWPLLIIAVPGFGVWTYIVMTTTSGGLRGPQPYPGVFLWVLMWVVIGSFAAASWLWAVFGQEVISVRSGVFNHRREVFGLGTKGETHSIHELFNLRASGVFFENDPLRNFFVERLFGQGTVSVDTRYGDTFRFGSQLDEHEANALVATLAPYFRRPTYTPTEATSSEIELGERTNVFQHLPPLPPSNLQK